MKRLVAACLMLVSVEAFAMAGAGAGGGPGVPGDADVAAGSKAIADKNWTLAVQAFAKALQNPENAKSAEVYNRLGYAQRHAGQMPDALKSYARALELDPKHKGAHEYAGDAYLRLGDLAKAKHHLAELNKLCLFGCPEYTDLKAKVAQVEAGKPLTN
jgi:tetratricopeptide (TPR) repeat protein